MRFHAMLLGAALALGALFVPAVSECRADVTSDTVSVAAPAPQPSQTSGAPAPATADEERSYEQREAQSPEAREFKGGGGGFVIALLVVAALVLLIILLAKEV